MHDLKALWFYGWACLHAAPPSCLMKRRAAACVPPQRRRQLHGQLHGAGCLERTPGMQTQIQVLPCSQHMRGRNVAATDISSTSYHCCLIAASNSHGDKSHGSAHACMGRQSHHLLLHAPRMAARVAPGE